MFLEQVVLTVFLSAAASTVQSEECSKSVLGGGYSGSVSETSSGIVCQRWDSQDPHSHGWTDPKMFPDDTMEDAANKCRNPDFEDGGAWCYTTDPEVRWQHCDIPFCPAFPECKVTEAGTEYRGTLAETLSELPCYPTEGHDVCRNPDDKPDGPWCFTDDEGSWDYCDVPLCKVSSSCKRTEIGQEYVGTLSVTANGRPCQRWDKQFPHNHPHTDPDQFPDASLEDANNYCRNPDGDTSGLWCYTQDPNILREYCDVRICQDCKVTTQGKEYAGTLSETTSGETCQRWDAQSPHPHDLTDPDRYPDASLEDATNFCRNPDSKNGGPWCFTTNPEVEWEHCDIGECEGCEEDTPSFRTVRHVVQFGLDGFAPCFVDSPSGAPNMMTRLAEEGTYTIDGARTVLISGSGPAWGASQYGSDMETLGITANTWRPPWKGFSEDITPTTGLDIPFPSVYRQLKAQDANIRTATFYDWPWHHHIMDYGDPDSVDLDYYCAPSLNGGTEQCDTYLAYNASEYLREALLAAESTYTLVYFDSLDYAGHGHGWCGEHYLATVDFVDDLVGIVLDAIDDVNMADEVLIFLSSDHGGQGTVHGCWHDDCLLIPLFIRGPGIKVNHQLVHAVRNQDIVTTAMHAMGFQPSPWWSAQVMTEAFDL